MPSVFASPALAEDEPPVLRVGSRSREGRSSVVLGTQHSPAELRQDDTLFGPAGADLDTAEVPGGLPRKPAYIGRTDLVFESGWRAALVQFYQHHIGGQRGAVGEYD